MRKIGCFGMLVALAAIVALFVLVQSWGGAGPAKQTTTVLIRDGETLSDAAGDLQKAGAIGSARRFVLLARLLGSDAPIKAGEYRIPAHLSQSDILKMMQGGETLRRLVTIPEGMPSVMVRDRLMAAKGLTGTIGVPAEGSVLPDTYEYERDATRAAVLGRTQAAMTRYLAQAWAKRSPNLAVTTPEQAVTLASIVEKETAKPEERAMVAGVYMNRLRAGMPLQADPTIIYPITKGRALGRRIRESEVRAKNAYNTYSMTGLPAGPICNPGRKSLDAVLHPASTKALYFVADGTGGHVFADTLEEQNANVAKWYAIRRARGEM
ncbi:MAG: endolytic transglycosylase MltG [Sphingomonas sp.]